MNNIDYLSLSNILLYQRNSRWYIFRILSILLFAVITIYINQYVLYAQDDTPQDTVPTTEAVETIEQNDTQDNLEDTVLGTLLFSAEGELYTFSEIIDNNLYKGINVYFDVTAGSRYAVITTSETIDTLQRGVINNITVYRDLYLGENAGIVFTPNIDDQVVFTVFATGRLDGSYKASDIILSTNNDTQYNNSESNSIINNNLSIENNIDEQNIKPVIKLGNYLVQVYELPTDPNIISLPFLDEAFLVPQNKIAHRVAKEYRATLEENKRIYVRMYSQDFDTLLEVSDRFGRSIISDDWGEHSSLITFEVPKTDDYYVTTTSFNGRYTGEYTLEIIMTENELLEEINGQITPESPKILQKFANEHPLDITKGEYLTAVVQALDNTIDLAVINENLNAIYYEKVLINQTKVLPLFIAAEGNYKLLVLNEFKVVSNYKLTLYK